MSVFLIIGGTLMVAVGLWDVFQTLFHPAGRGTLSDWITAGIWRGLRATGRAHLLTIAGPVGLVSVIFAWVALVVFGFALIFWPAFNRDLVLAPGMDPARHHTFLDCLNLSLGSLITVGGDLYSQARWMRLLMGVEAVLGFGLLTASLSALMSIYRALERRNSFAMQLTLLHHSELTRCIRPADLDRDIAFDLLIGLAGELASIRTDLEQFPVTYYFRSQDPHSALPGILPYLQRLADEAARPGRSRALVMAGTSLGGAIQEYLKYINRHYLQVAPDEGDVDAQEVLRAYAEDHMRTPVDLTLGDHDHHLAA